MVVPDRIHELMFSGYAHDTVEMRLRETKRVKNAAVVVGNRAFPAAIMLVQVRWGIVALLLQALVWPLQGMLLNTAYGSAGCRCNRMHKSVRRELCSHMHTKLGICQRLSG